MFLFDLTSDQNSPDEPYIAFIRSTSLTRICSLLEYEYVTNQDTMNVVGSLYIYMFG